MHPARHLTKNISSLLEKNSAVNAKYHSRIWSLTITVFQLVIYSIHFCSEARKPQLSLPTKLSLKVPLNDSHRCILQVSLILTWYTIRYQLLIVYRFFTANFYLIQLVLSFKISKNVAKRFSYNAFSFYLKILSLKTSFVWRDEN